MTHLLREPAVAAPAEREAELHDKAREAHDEEHVEAAQDVDRFQPLLHLILLRVPAIDGGARQRSSNSTSTGEWSEASSAAWSVPISCFRPWTPFV